MKSAESLDIQNMELVRSSDIQNKWGEYWDKTLIDPIMITKHNRPGRIMMSLEEYRRITQRSQRALHPSELSPEDLETIRNAKVPEKYADLDDGMED